ncbi:MAG TPA: hypothetical protein VGR19_08410 [Allosphingosinicella sp.]|nr:hypothetical protein [Allosphingosinicella sp.]
MKHFAVLALLLPGCATVYDLDNRMPDARYTSQKSVPALTQCIHAGMRNLGTAQVEQGAETTYITLTTQTGNPAARVTIRPTQTGSVVLARQTINYSLGPVIQRCV